jgi:hypothetical protein
MQFLAALAVASIGIGCYAVAALLFDRRRQVGRWMLERRAAAARPRPAGRTRQRPPTRAAAGSVPPGVVPPGAVSSGAVSSGATSTGAGRSAAAAAAGVPGSAAGPGRPAAAVRTVAAASGQNPVLMPILGCLALGTLLIFGSCVGLIAF